METNKKYFSDNDLIRSHITRKVIFVIGLLSVILGTRHWDFFHNWKGFMTVMIGVFFLLLLLSAYEKLLLEKK